VKSNKLLFVNDIFIHSEDNRVLYLNPVAPDWITISIKYKPIFDLFNNENEKNIFSYIKNNYSDEKDILIPQIKKLIKTSKIFKRNHKITNQKIKRIKFPYSIYLTLTDNCNLNCKYCYAIERDNNENITFEKWKEYVSSIVKFSKKPIFTFTGGEPLIIPYIFDLASFVKSKGSNTILLTNGTLITSNEIAKKISESFDLVKISIDSLDDDVSKYLRGDGVLKKVKNAFQLLCVAGCNVSILATVTSKTCEQLDVFAKYFNNQVNFQPLYSIGRAKNMNDLFVTGEQYYNALTKSGKFNLLREYKNKIFNFKNNPCTRCSMAATEISINSNGDVFPCHMLHYKEYICGNLNNHSIKKIYYNSKKINELRKINVDILPQCKKCNFRYFCGGACRARIDIQENGIYGHDNFCVFEQKQILDALIYSYG